MKNIEGVISLLEQVLEHKNREYGNSILSLCEAVENENPLLYQIYHKVSRFVYALTKKGEVKDDTLFDLAGYIIILLAYRLEKKGYIDIK